MTQTAKHTVGTKVFTTTEEPIPKLDEHISHSNRKQHIDEAEKQLSYINHKHSTASLMNKETNSPKKDNSPAFMSTKLTLL